MSEPIAISSTTFVDFLLTSGLSKISVVRRAKEQYSTPYDPKQDFWRILRKGIIDMHVRGMRPVTLNKILENLQDAKKRRLYPGCVAAYQRWIGRKTITWTGTSNADWQHEDLTVNVNPELGLTINGKKHCVKLYFKKEQLAKRRVQTLLHLLRTTMPVDTNTALGILDVPRGKLLTRDDNPIPKIDALLRGEARSFRTIWNEL